MHRCICSKNPFVDLRTHQRLTLTRKSVQERNRKRGRCAWLSIVVETIRTGNVSSWLGGCTLEQLLSDRWREYRGGGGTGRARRWPRGRRRERGKRVS